ncbi:MAG: hypothetical protein JWM16_1722 [Verrucomicrobiales bacterium]|nr:hypothetical protein [Verrucomicrobiales bacterium]
MPTSHVQYNYQARRDSLKQILILVLVSMFCGCGHAQDPGIVKSLWRATIKVVDEAGDPIEGAKVTIGYHVTPFEAQTVRMAKATGLTDRAGVFRAAEQSQSIDLEVRAEKTGFYPTFQRHELGVGFDPEKQNPHLTLILKKVGEPIPMYARRLQIQIPEVGKPIGFDLLQADWVTPHGTGTHTDLMFQVNRRWESRNDFEYVLKVSATTPTDGLMEFPVRLDQGSELRMPGTVPQGAFKAEVVKVLSRTPGLGWKQDSIPEQNYYFRIRSKLDDTGGIKSALYGKVYGDFVIDPINSKTSFILFTYYINPEPNSRNVEFDPSKNLARKSKAPDEDVRKP